MTARGSRRWRPHSYARCRRDAEDAADDLDRRVIGAEARPRVATTRRGWRWRWRTGRREDPSHVAEARVAERGIEPVREGTTRAGDGGAGGGDEADDGAVRGAAVPGTIDVLRGAGAEDDRLSDARDHEPARRPDSARPERVEILHALSSPTAGCRPGPTCPPPFRRGDVTREADLIEEVARIDGLEKLPVNRPRGTASGGPPHPSARRRAADVLRPGAGRDRGRSFTRPSSATGCGSDHPHQAGARHPAGERPEARRMMLLGSRAARQPRPRRRDPAPVGGGAVYS